MSKSHITLLMGPVSSGKTTAALQELATPYTGQTFFLVPGGLQQQQIKQRLPHQHIRVQTFTSLARSILRAADADLPPLDDATRSLLLRGLLRDMAAAGELPQFARVAQKPGFIALIGELLDEARSAEVTPHMLEHVSGIPYTAELSAVYATYRARLVQLGQADSAGYLERARDLLLNDARADAALSGGVRLIVDGFDQFTRLQHALLEVLAQRSEHCLITLTCATDERPAHRRFWRTYEELVTTLAPVVKHMETDIQAEAPALAHIERHLFDLHPPDTEPAPVDAAGAVHLIEAADREREVRAALRRVRALQNAGTSLEDMAIVLRGGDAYVPLLREVAAEYSLPLAVHYGLPLAEAPAVVALLTALRLPLEDFPARSLGEVWRSLDDKRLMLTTYTPPLSYEYAASLLNRMTHSAGIVGGLERLRHALQQLAETAPASDADEEITPARPVTSEEAAKLLEMLDTFAALLTPPAQASLHEYATWTRNLGLAIERGQPAPPDDEETEETDTTDAADASNPHQSARRRWQRLLESLDAAASTLDEPDMSYDRWLADLENTVAGARYGQARIPKNKGVRVLSVLAARGLHFGHVLVLGMADGEFPRKLPPPPLYTRRERAVLAAAGVPLLPPDPADERTLFYETVGRARQSLTLAYTYLDEQGNEIPPSPYIAALCALVQPQSVVEEHIIAGSIPSLEQAVSQQEQLVALLDTDAITPTIPAPLPPLLEHVRRAHEIEQHRESTDAYGEHEGLIEAEDVQAVLAEKFGAQHAWSVTQFNAYITCPFRFAAAHVLGLQAPGEPDEGLARVGRGLLYHDILKLAGQRWRDAELYFSDENKEEILDILRAATDEVLAEVSERPDFVQGAFWEWEQADVRRRLERAMRRVLHPDKDGDNEWADFRVAAVEQSFGMGGRGSLLRLDTEAGQVRIRGRIDRIDQREDGSLAIIDYKSSSSPRPLSETRSARDVQLAVYLLAAQQLPQLQQPVERAAFLHLGSGKFSPLLTEAHHTETIDALRAHVAETVAGARRGDFAVRPRDDCPPACTFQTICRRNFAKRDAQQGRETG